jgi:hypothetical protein
MASKSGGPGSQKMTTSGGRSHPRATELKDAAEERIVALFKKGTQGCRLTSIPPPLSAKDKKRLRAQRFFAAQSTSKKIDILHEKLIGLRDRQLKLAGRSTHRLDIQIEELERDIAELIRET